MSPLNRALMNGACIVIIVAGLKLASSVVGFVLFAVLLATCISPLVNLMVNKGISRKLALTITIIVVILGGFLIVTMIGTSISRLLDTLPGYESRLGELQNSVNSLLARFNLNINEFYPKSHIDPKSIVSVITRLLGVFLSAVSTSLILLLLVSLILIEIVGFESKIAAKTEIKDTLSTRLFEIRKDIRKFLSITALSGLIIAILNTILLLILGVDFPVLWGVLSFLASFIPAVGGIIAFIPPALMAFLQFGSTKSIVVIVGFIIINNVIDNVLKPKLMKQDLNISILLIFLSLMFWSWVLGPIGAILAIPLTIFVKKLLVEFKMMNQLSSDKS